MILKFCIWRDSFTYNEVNWSGNLTSIALSLSKIVFSISSLKNPPYLFNPFTQLTRGEYWNYLNLLETIQISSAKFWGTSLSESVPRSRSVGWSWDLLDELIKALKPSCFLRFQNLLLSQEIGLATDLFFLVFASSISSSKNIEHATRTLLIFVLSSSPTNLCFNVCNRVAAF